MSQKELAQQIDALAAELHRFNEVAKVPELSPYVDKLTMTRQKLDRILAVLERVEKRVEVMRKTTPVELAPS